ncbi:MAG: tetratricopeptide repeat protein [Gammaproteobacteria bacterium]|nr:tetratricopeptide repeat protein [Gammaproteobacteria bacterium]MDH3412602.1 tetratricopeptide repeat protein [Gammaproteobacteria bacterium]
MRVFGLRTGLLLGVLASAFAALSHADTLDDARSLLSQGRYDAAIQRLDSHLKTSPNDSKARFLKGVALAEAGRRQEAIDVFSALVNDSPELPEPHNNLAVLYASTGELEKARAHLLEAIRIHPSYATAHENLGDVYAKMAALEYDKAFNLDGANQSARTKHALAEKLTRMEPGDGARTALVTAKAQPPAPPATVMPSATAAPSPPPAGFENGVLASVRSWADAWSSQDTDTYLNHYAESFVPADGRSKKEWTILRRKRVSGPQFIDIVIARPQVKRIDDDRASVTFEQSYRSDSYADQVVKTVELVRQGESWKILSELTVN